ncbi:MAG: flagellar filament capping protein FliD [Deltaproteobacteria bacterium]|nr:flagellar filament capping protein FliD [Nannocystaceae bacterium]
MAAAISFSGLASGLDTKAIVNAMLGVERIPMQRLQAQNANLTSKTSVIGKLSSALAALKTTAEALGTAGDFLSYSGSVGDTAAAKVTTSGGSVPGSYALEVVDLAQAQRTYSNPQTDADAAMSATDQIITLTIGTTVTNIDIPAGTNLRGIATALNASGADVSAGLMYDGSTYRLQVVGRSTGAANAITFADSGLGLGLSATDNTFQVASDASLLIDGFPVTSASNVVDDVLPGTTVELKARTTTPTQISIAPDPSEVSKKLQKFVDAYNAVSKLVNDQQGVGKGAETLNGDSTVRMIQQGLSRLISSPIPGLVGPGGTMQLSDLGIQSQRDGTLTLDTADLDTALAADFSRAASYFVGDGTNAGIGALLGDLVDSYVDTDGLLTTRKKGIESLIKSNTTRMDEMAAYLERYEDSLNAMYSKLEQTMSELNSQSAYMAQFLQ